MVSTAGSLFFDHSQHKLKVWGITAPLDVLAFSGEEHLSQPFAYQIAFTSPEKDLQPAQMLMQDASLTLNAPPVTLPMLGFAVPEPMPLRTLHGVISGFKRLSTSRDESRYEVTLVPRLALLANSHQNRIYQHLSVPEIVEKVLRERHGFKGQDFLFTLAHTYPKRELVMQYGEDDLKFVSRLLAEVGIWFRFTAAPRLKIDVVEFYDDQRHYQFGLTLPLRSPSGLDSQGSECVWALETAHNVVEGKVSTRDYNYRDAGAAMDAEVDVSRGDKTTYGEAYHYADNYLTLGDQYAQEPDPESGVFYARLRHERYLNQQTQLSGMTTSASLTPGQELKVVGADAPAVFQKGAVITGIRSQAARDKSYEVAFTAIPYSETVCYRPEPSAKPVMAGTIPARVTSTLVNDTYSHIDKDGRYRVSFNLDRDEWQAGYESLWVRLARPYAGDVYGLHLPLLSGVEVGIAFEGGNPDRPYIAHALHDSKHPDHVTIANYKRNVLRTAGLNKIRLDDERGKEHIKLSTVFGASQFSIGHLVDSAREQRGAGFEARTDLFGAIRAAKGIFITADAQPKAQGAVLEMGAALGQLRQAGDQMQSLSEDAQAANADPAKVNAQLAMLKQDIDQLKSAVLLMSAPKGIAVTSGEHLQLAAAQNLMVNAGNQADIGVVKNLFVGVGQAFSLFVRKLGMKLIANQGPISVQAQNDQMELLARKAINITSTEDEICITAKKKITLNAGGTYITLDANKIESGTAGDYLIKSASFAYTGPATQSGETPVMPMKAADPIVRSSFS
ncbi:MULTISPECIES: type VI secretion system Vgr family protein [unclassified Serratia (in: enterobacteria)]|uniref:type VI secretion system Vgr family protein n=1 Tax=unclassified Serratia (in: enterobacteria) TaxID=2647522 RepID=UPI003076768E